MENKITLNLDKIDFGLFPSIKEYLNPDIKVSLYVNNQEIVLSTDKKNYRIFDDIIRGNNYKPILKR